MKVQINVRSEPIEIRWLKHEAVSHISLEGWSNFRQERTDSK